MKPGRAGLADPVPAALATVHPVRPRRIHSCSTRGNQHPVSTAPGLRNTPTPGTAWNGHLQAAHRQKRHFMRLPAGCHAQIADPCGLRANLRHAARPLSIRASRENRSTTACSLVTMVQDVSVTHSTYAGLVRDVWCIGRIFPPARSSRRGGESERDNEISAHIFRFS